MNISTIFEQTKKDELFFKREFIIRFLANWKSNERHKHSVLESVEAAYGLADDVWNAIEHVEGYRDF